MWIVAVFAARGRGRFAAVMAALRASLRVATYLAVILSITLGFFVTRAKAQLREQTTALAKELLPIADLLEGVTALRINGERVNFSMTMAPNATVAQVLDRVQAQCEKHPGPFAKRMLELAAGVPEKAPGSAELRALLSRAALLREQSAEQGALLCFTGEATEGVVDVSESFGNTRDLGALGRLRYVLVSRGDAARNEENLIRVVTLWTEDRFRLDAFESPAFGDAPGSDSKLIPRPPQGVRTFTAEAVGSAYSVRLYETDALPKDVLAFYDRSMAGFERHTMPSYEDRGRGYIRDAQPVLVQAFREETKTIVALTEVGAHSSIEQALR